jgi:hypothetical protein
MTTQYLAFGTGGSANTLSYAAYAALTTFITNGFQPGIVSSPQFNTLMRQLSVAVAGTALFASNNGQTMNDDGNPTNFATGLQAAVDARRNVSVLPTSGTPYGFKVGTVIVMFGVYTTDIPDTTPATITFPAAFPTACLGVLLTPRNPTNDGAADAWVEFQSSTAANFVVGAQWGGGGAGSHLAHGCNWVAFGY